MKLFKFNKNLFKKGKSKKLKLSQRVQAVGKELKIPKGKKVKSLKFMILQPSITIIVVSLLFMGIATIYLNYKSTMYALEQSLTETVTLAADRTGETINKVRELVNQFADVSRLKGTELTDGDKKLILAQKLGVGYFEEINMAYRDGANLDGDNISSNDYFISCISTKKPYITEPFYSKEKGKLLIVVAAPIMDGTDIYGVVYGIADANFISDITKTIQIGETGESHIIDKNGTVIGYKELLQVINQYNVQNEAVKDPSLQPLADIEREMMAGKTGFAEYKINGKSEIMAYAPVPNTNGWSIGVSVLQNEFLDQCLFAVILTFLAVAVFTIIGVVIMLRVQKAVATPLQICGTRLKKLAEGDLHSDVPAVLSQDEIGELMALTGDMVVKLKYIIEDANVILNEMAIGNFNINVENEYLYVGDFKAMSDSITHIIDNLNFSLGKINESSDQVSGGAEQVASAAQALSQGATEQASSIEELSATITQISEQINQNAKNANDATVVSAQASNELITSNQKMDEMISAMSDISKKSDEIKKIIKTIDDIAFQTNILALNAAVEAARAGAAGKGFAVVADEVRSLAGKSAEAAKNTAELIEQTIKSVASGTEIVDNAAKALESVLEGGQKSTELLHQIAAASNEQADAVNQVTMGVEQISVVVQTNSATAEESAATSEQLSDQAQILHNIVSEFKLKGTKELQHQD